MITAMTATVYDNKTDVYTLYTGKQLFLHHWNNNHIDSLIVNLLASIVVDHGFDPRSGKTKDYKIGICCLSSKHTRKKSKNWLAWSQENVSVSGATCLSTDCCLSELAL